VKIIPIKAYIIPTDTITFDILSTRATFYAGDTISFLMIPKQSSRNKGLRDISFSINYNGDLLTFNPNKTQVLIKNARYITALPGGTPKHSYSRIFFEGLPTLEFDASVAVMQIVFTTALTDSITSDMFLSNVLLNGGDTIYSKCTLGVVSSDISATLSLRCGDSTLIRFMRLEDLSSLVASSIIPDPLTNSTNWIAHLPFVSRGGGVLRLEIFDALGRRINSNQIETYESGANSFSIDASNFAAGNYHYILTNTTSSARVTGLFNVLK
jgi:hypothetical protein